MFDLGAAAIRSGRSDTRKRSDGRLFLAEAAETRQLEPRVLLSLTYTDFQIPLVEVVQPQGITTGPDGNLWFTENRANRIGRETPGGSLTEFALPAGVLSPGAITPGPDGNVWFTALRQTGDGTDQKPVVSRITTDGTVTVFPLPDATASFTSLTDITGGPDGALWFTGLSGRVGRMTTTGVESESTLPDVPPPSGSPPGAANLHPTPIAITSGPDGNLWLTSDAARIWRLSTSGDFTGFEVAGLTYLDYNSAITSGPDGALWFTGYGGNITEVTRAKVGRITTAGVESDFATPGFTPGSSIATGPDGNLWFTSASRGNQIARMTTSGVTTLFDVPGNYAYPGELTAGPDGNVWFTEKEDGYTTGQQPALGKITPTGVTSLYPIPQRMTLDPSQGIAVYPEAITLGPDGALWFAEGAGKIGRITTDGTLREFALPTPEATAGAITAGPDGAIWFTESSSIGRITTAGLITTFALPDGSDAKSITKGRDGNLWFTEDFTDPVTGDTSGVIGRITPQGSIKTFTVSLLNAAHSGQVGAITSGPDGNLWFTGQYTDKKGKPHQSIGQITIRGKVQVFSLPTPPDDSPDFAYSPPSSVITGPDGKLWFDATVHGKRGIARISTRGEFGRTIPAHPQDELYNGPNGQVWFPGYGLSTATRSGIVVARDLPNQYYGYYTVNIGGMAAAPDGNLWFTDRVSKIVRISGLDTPEGGLDYRHRPKRSPDYDTQDQVWTDTAGTAHPTFAGVAKPGTLVTLLAQRQGESRFVKIGRVHTNRRDGSWTLTSHHRLKDGLYAVIAIQKGDSEPPTALYSLDVDPYGDRPNALTIDTSRHVKKAEVGPTGHKITTARSVPNAFLARKHARR
jgi:streptogramin lyase